LHNTDAGLTDLDALLSTVRDLQSRVYLTDAVLAYRVGALRLSIVGTWTAVAYDIISKIRELATSEGEPQAIEFIRQFDNIVETADIARFLKTERELIDTASTTFGFPSSTDAVFLKRLQEDRHLCAHPAFTHNNELFRPVPDAVRAHLVQSVVTLLALPPMSGKAIIESIVSDISSNAFPRDRERAIEYMQQRYLNRMRSTAKRNLASVLLKAQINGTPASLDGFEDSVLDSLDAMHRDDAAAFRIDFAPIAIELIDRAAEDGLIKAVRLVRRFPLLVSLLPSTAQTRILALATSSSSDLTVYSAFGQISSEIDDALLDRLTELEAGSIAMVLQMTSDIRMFPAVIQSVRDANTFRSAEARLANVVPLAPTLSQANVSDLIDAVSENSQILHAARAPGLLMQILQTVDRATLFRANWDKLNRAYWYGKNYSEMWEFLRINGIYEKPAGPPADDDE
jgi:hypothetical protein